MGSIISQVYLKINPFFLKSQGEKRILTNIFGFLIARLLIATNIAQQMNQNIPVARSRSLTVGLFLSLVSLGSFLCFLSQKTWLTATAIQQEEKDQQLVRLKKPWRFSSRILWLKDN